MRPRTPVHRSPLRPRLVALATLGALGLALAGCGSSSDGSGSGASGGGDPKTLVVATHDSWAMDEDVLADFTKQTGITVKIQPQGDAGQLTNKLVLTKDNPLADGVYGIDNTFGSRAVDEGILAEDTAVDLPASAEQFRLQGAGDRLTPVDYSDVCVNVDDSWFEKRGQAPPTTLDDLVDPAYADLFVTPGASTSSPGLAFLLATVAAKGDAWPDYWKQLVANGTKVVSGWSDAYEVDFTAGGGSGDRPIVTSYSSSPPFTVPEGGTKPTTSALLDTCFRQVEYAGVLAGAKNPQGMAEFISFMLGREFQAALPDNMYVYPVDDAVALPAAWEKFAEPASDPFAVDPQEVDANREKWLGEWRDIVTQ
ncbi:thiamine transport system substrate-binding protein [Nocardioides scoriae]|uniref:Thiamine transport system substrate-binding protein n=1 Tax=Nocardioides scoriae TaxID=642780 RepID=A0A1H1U2X2_9ACTN|nr:thiamine ABC transporter substrate-binding protein [Nocardioides scoriae]SDS66764.1 thiamine transport system substrate-binding protein [Nocardioides scoriae]